MINVKISVIMPVYNAEEYILESVTSLLKQTYKNFEIIIIDDGSTDHTREVLKTIQDERVKYIYQENSDQLNALLNATDYITGEIVCLFHADDILASNYSFERNIDFLKKNSDLEGLYCDLIQIDENSNVKGIYLKTPSK